MADYIDRDAVLREIRDYAHRLTDEQQTAFVMPIAIIEAVPAADVAPVVHGMWLPDMELFDDDPASGAKGGYFQTGWKCSICGRNEPQKEPYCNCGVKMDLEPIKEVNP